MKLLSKASDIKGKRVVVRVDYNVPIEDGVVGDIERLNATIPTIRLLQKNECKIVLLSHLGRPKGKVVPELSLAPVAKELSKLLGEKVLMLGDCIGEKVKAGINGLKKGEIALLENTRFHPEDEADEPGFAKELASLGEVFVFEGFAVGHRKGASVTGIQDYLPSYIGLLVERELDSISSVLKAPKHPFVVVLGGAKLSDKLGVINHMGSVADNILVGGAMAFPILKAQGTPVGSSYVEEGAIELARGLKISQKVVLPLDFIVADSRDANSGKTVAAEKIADGKLGLDIGEATIARFIEILSKAKTIVWNGPMGLFENPAFASGTKAVAEGISASGAKSLVGGGDTISAIHQLAPKARFTHVSTGGGALLDMLSGKKLPALRD